MGSMGENDKYEGHIPGNGRGEAGDGGSEQQVAESVATGQPQADLQQEIELLKKERDGLYDRLLRKQAEFENYRKRVDREKSEFIQFASAELMKELLNALDSFDLALRNASRDGAGSERTLRGFGRDRTLRRHGGRGADSR